MKAQDTAHPSDSITLLTHPILWLRKRNEEVNTRRQVLSSPYSIHLPVLPSYLYFKWQEMSLKDEHACLEKQVFRYQDEKGRAFSAWLEVDRWQGVFNLNECSDMHSIQALSDMEFWGLALRERGNPESIIDNSSAQGAVFWHEDTLHIYPAQLGPAFESFLRECLLQPFRETSLHQR